ncbi:MAG: hypothetical protein EP338_07220 [Bacteroidetes bacterium]|nr:MAG: hypothetical protein EP338_07220 [Bacteroidota bacterium]
MKSLIVLLFVGVCTMVVAQNNTPLNTNSAEPIRNANEVPVEEELEIRKPVSRSKAEELQKAKKYDRKVKESVQQQAVELGNFKSSFQSSKHAAGLQSTRRTPTDAQQINMNQVVEQYRKQDPNSFEYNYFKYASGNHNTDWYKYLQKAEKFKPNNTDVISLMVAYHSIEGNDQQMKNYLKRLLSSGRLEEELLVYAKHLLDGVSKGGALITHGFDDTYSVLYQQAVKGYRSDVYVISLDFIQSKQLRRTLAEKAYKVPVSMVVDVRFLKEFCEQNKGKKLFLSMTIPKPYLKAIVNDLGISGLAFEYGRESSDLKKNGELWDKWSANGEVNSYTKTKTKKMSSNYLLMLHLLNSGQSGGGYSYSTGKYQKAIDQIMVQSKKGSYK